MIIENLYATYGIVLLPTKNYRDEAINFSRRLNLISPSNLILNSENSIPHITVAHIPTTYTQVKDVWDSCITAFPDGLSVEPFTLFIRPGNGHIWVGVEVRRTHVLQELHTDVAVECKQRDLTITSEADDQYWPHITIAQWNSMPKQQIPIDPVITKQFQVQPALVLMGNHGAASQILEQV